MTSRLGLELGPQTIRAVHLSGLRGAKLRTLEISWDPEKPGEAIADLHRHLGTARHVTAAVDLALLHVKQLELPPLPLQEKRRLLGMEPDRYFAVRGDELAFALREADDLVFAARESLLSAWISALAPLGRVERIEPGPVSVARALGKADVREGFVLRNGRNAGVELLELAGGGVRAARRVFGDLSDAAEILATHSGVQTGSSDVLLAPWDEASERALSEQLPRATIKRPPRVAALDPDYLTAYGAALADDEGWRQALLTPELEQEQLHRHRARVGVAAVACAAALVFALFSVDAYRGRAEQNLDSQLAALRQQAQPALTLQSRLAALERETRAVAAVAAERPDPLRGLLELSQLLPEGAWIRSIRAGDGELELDGYARDAAALIPLFENDPRFEEVSFRSATSRAQIGAETYENFSLALKLVRAP